MKRSVSIFLFLAFTLPVSAGAPFCFSANDYIRALKQVTDVMVYDVTSPVAASRYYAYVTLAANEVYAAVDPAAAANSFKQQLNRFDGIAIEKAALQKGNASFASLFALYKMGETLLPSGSQLHPLLDSVIKLAQAKSTDGKIVEQSLSIADAAVLQLKNYIRGDNFKNLSGYARYKPLNGDEHWQPTAPAFMQPVEPYWYRLRPFFLDSCQQFKPAPPALFDTSKSSHFYSLLREVYTLQKNLTEQQRAIAAFWDCNPFAVQQIGHIEFGLKRISPGGHWMGITGVACQKAKTTFAQTAFIHTIVALALADGFISCWDEKYRSNRVRPETAINKFVDPAWRPVLQTPPFPEYPSGHSVVSAAAATVLARFFGNQFSFTDTTEQEFDLPVRRFSSFNQAAEEAAVSRLYGGIHYRDAVENGLKQGRLIGAFVLQKVQQKAGVVANKHR